MVSLGGTVGMSSVVAVAIGEQIGASEEVIDCDCGCQRCDEEDLQETLWPTTRFSSSLSNKRNCVPGE